MNNSQMQQLIDENCRSRRNRELLKARLIDGEKIKDLAEKYDLSERQIKNIVKKFRESL